MEKLEGVWRKKKIKQDGKNKNIGLFLLTFFNPLKKNPNPQATCLGK